jgi:Zn-dependent M28 family amino/carboxypeptidase
MRMARSPRAALALLFVALLALAGCGTATLAEPSVLPGRSIVPVEQFPPLGFAADEGRLHDSLAALQAIADDHDGVRTVGTPGYEASVDWAAGQLRELGFAVDTPEEPITTFRELPGSLLEVGDHTFHGPDELHALIYSAGGDVRGEIAILAASGCEASDFADLPRGAIAVTTKSGCLRRQQVTTAAAAGAAALLFVYPDRDAGQILRPTLISPGGIDIPAVAVTREAGRALAAAAGTEAHLVVATQREPGTLRNVIGQLGDGERVIMLGGHLDSVVDGPGINDNGSGIADLLEIARGVTAIGVPDGASVRIAFWGGEEFGLLGSGAYVHGLSGTERSAILAYLNLDMVGSPNGVTFVYDDPHGPRGSGGITIDYEVWFAQHDLPTEREELGGSSDHYWFAESGIPTGGLFSGATETKTAAQAAAEGGTAGTPTDACYHLPCDTIENVDLHRAAAYADATLAVALRLAAAPD